MGIKKRIVALAAAVPLAIMLLPGGSAMAEPNASHIEEVTNAANEVLDLGFDGALHDASPAGNTVRTHNGNIGYAKGVSGQALRLASGSLDLGVSRKLQPKSFSLSLWWNPSEVMTGEQILMWCKGVYNGEGWYLSSNSDDKPLVLSIGTGAPQPLEFNMTGDRAKIFPAHQWTHVMVTFNAASKTARFYINGEGRQYSQGNTEQPGTVNPDDSVKYIGWNGAHHSGGQLDGSLDEFKMWNVAATSADVEREVKVGDPRFDPRALAQKALDDVDIPSKALVNIPFVADSTNGSSLTYSSDNRSVISDTGVVTRPPIGAGDAKAKLTVTSSYGSASVSKQVDVTVPAMSEDQDGSGLLDESGMTDVQVDDAYLKNASEKEIRYLLSFDTDRLLVEFRAHAGLDTKGVKNYGGWESGYSSADNPDGATNPTRFTGHFVGHYLTAVSQAERSTFATSTQKAQLSAKLKAVVDGINEAQRAYAAKDSGNAGFFPAFNVDAVPNGRDGLLVPFYDLHKVEQGMVSAYDYSNDEAVRQTAKSSAVAFAKWVLKWHQSHPSTSMLATEYGGMNDALYQTAAIADTSDKQMVLQAAHLFDETSLFANLAQGRDVLNGLHANTTIPKLVGAMQRYVTYTSDSELYHSLSAQDQVELKSLYLAAARNFWTIVTRDHSYANGGNSWSEHFHEAGQLWKDATQNGDDKGGYRDSSTVETCNEYNMLKLSRLLFQVDHDAKYCEYYEHTFINAILASQNPENGMTTYFQPMKAGYPKVFGIDGTGLYGSEIGEFWCCQGSGIENFSKLNDSIYFTGDRDVYVNMFRSSVFNDKRHHLKITQIADVPKRSDVNFEVAGSGTAKLKLRVPVWSNGASLSVDGSAKSVDDKDEAGWLTVPIKNGTKITYTLPAKLASVAAPDNPDWVAFQYGPVLLAGSLAKTDPKTNYSYGGVKVRVSNFDADANAKAAIVPSGGQSVTTWLKGVEADATSGNLIREDRPGDGQALTFRFANVDGATADVRLHPYYSTYQSSYALYWDLAEVDSEAYQRNIVKQKSDEALAGLKIDSVDAFDNEFQQELAHHAAKSADSNAGTYAGRQYRDAQAGGWFSYDLKVRDGGPNYLATLYNIADKGRSFDLSVDPTPSADPTQGTISANARVTAVTIGAGETASHADDSGFYWNVAKIPDDILSKATGGKVRVIFKSSGGLVGGIYGVRTQRAAAYASNASLRGLSFGSGVLAPAFSAQRSSYTLTVAKSCDRVSATIGVGDPGAYASVNGVVIDDRKPRDITLDGDVTMLEIASYAQDHQTVRYYSITIAKQGSTPSVSNSGPKLLYDFDGMSDFSDGQRIANRGSGHSAFDGVIAGDGVSSTGHQGNGEAMTLPGGASASPAPYVKIPAGLVGPGQKDMTVSAEYAWNGQSNCVYPWALGKNSRDYLVNIVNCGANTRVEASKAGAQTQLTDQTPAADRWVQVSVVVKGGQYIAYYRDGRLVRRTSTALGAADFMGTEAFSGYLGKSFYNDPYFGGKIDNFKVWDRALTSTELFNPDVDGSAISKPSSDATLKSLSVAGREVDLQEAAGPQGSVLQVDDPDSVRVEDVSASVHDDKARAEVSIASGVVQVKVVAEDGTTTKIYKVRLVRAAVDHPLPIPSPVLGAPAEAELTEANHQSGLIDEDMVSPGSLLRIFCGKSNAGRRVRVYLFSSPQLLGSLTLDAQGEALVRLPADVPEGTHRVAVVFSDGIASKTILAWDWLDVAGASGATHADSHDESRNPAAGRRSPVALSTTGTDAVSAVVLTVLLALCATAIWFLQGRERRRFLH